MIKINLNSLLNLAKYLGHYITLTHEFNYKTFLPIRMHSEYQRRPVVVFPNFFQLNPKLGSSILIE